MEVKIIRDEKNVLDIEVSSLTIAEVLRAYLNKEGAKLAVWKRDHPSKNPLIHIEGDNPKKLLKSAISSIEKELDEAVDALKKLK